MGDNDFLAYGYCTIIYHDNHDYHVYTDSVFILE